MNCVDVRDRLTELALGLLPAADTTDVERHLDWCAGCRKEATELQEAVATVGFSLPPATPPRGLQDKILGHFARGGTSRRTRGRDLRPGGAGRRGIRMLAAATLAAVLVATGAIGWAMAERRTAESTADRLQNARRLNQVIAGLGGRPFHVQLLPTAGFQTSGFAVIVSPPTGNNFVYVEILPPTPSTGPYSVQLVSRSGEVATLGSLAKSDGGDLFLAQFPSQDLSRAVTLSILDRSSDVVMSGTVSPYSKG